MEEDQRERPEVHRGLHVEADFPRGYDLQTNASGFTEMVKSNGKSFPFLGGPLFDASGQLVAVLGPGAGPMHRVSRVRAVPCQLAN